MQIYSIWLTIFSFLYLFVTHAHAQPFYSSLDFVWDNPAELVSEGTFCHRLDILVQNEDNTG